MSNATVVIPPITQNLRLLGDQISPTYLNGPVFKAYRYSMSVMFDDCIDIASYAVRARFPSIGPSDALQWTAQDRQIFQGPGETAVGYVARLIQWLDLWRLAGNPTSVMLAYLAWLTPLAPQISTVMSSRDGQVSVWRTYQAGVAPFPPGQTIPTPPDILTVTGGSNWNWDGQSQPYYFSWMRWRMWVIIQSNGAEAPWTAPTAVWGAGIWGDGVSCYGWTGTAQQAAQLTALAASWKSAGTWVPWIVVSYINGWMLPTNGFGDDAPDGHWGYYSKIVGDATYGQIRASARIAASTVTCITGTSDGGGVLGLG